MKKNTPATTTIKDWTIRNRRNYKPGKGTVIPGESMTRQNDTLSVADLLRKHISGSQVNEKPGIFIDDADHDDLDGEKFHQSDLAEKEDIRTGIRLMSERLKQEEQEYAKRQKDRQNKKDEGPKEPKNEDAK